MKPNLEIEEIISHFGMKRHPEGGWFAETYRSSIKLSEKLLGELGYPGSSRNLGTSILFLLVPGARSALHRLKADELWHFHAGTPVKIHMLGRQPSVRILGPGIHQGEEPQILVPGGTWQGAELEKGEEYALVGCTVFPGFEFHDFEIGKREQLLAEFPDEADVIRRLILV